ncbi:MAG: transglycosylase SLT domain-containing protein [Acidimicrobiales bacterium]
MTSPSPATIATSSEASQKVRRSPKAAKFAIALAALVGIAFATTACDPAAVSQDAIQKYWGGNWECAQRIAERESGLQPDAVNARSGATGLFQLMPSHSSWIKSDLGYDFAEMKDPYKNSEAAKLLSSKSFKANGDGWAPWRVGGARPGAGCPA